MNIEIGFYEAVPNTSSRNVQRPRRDRSPREPPNPPRDRRHKTRTPPPAPTVKEEIAVHSGSEEGEIEEE